MSERPKLDHDLARAIALALESEQAFGLRELPRGAALAAEAETAGPATRSLESIAETIASCRACGLCETRDRTVPGQGASRARLLFVGEAPGADEDASGQAFVGRAGQLLTKMIEAMGLSRDEVFIANILKCRPPENRKPRPDEVGACFPYLLDQIDLLQPELICALGATAAANLLERDEGIGRLRGRVFDFQGRQLIATYHPSYLLREPARKREAWQDLQLAMRILGLEEPGRGSSRT